MSSNLVLDMYTKLAHVAFHQRMHKAGEWMSLRRKAKSAVHIVASPKVRKNKHGCILMTEAAAKQCGVALADRCLKDRMVQFSPMDVPAGLVDVCISTGEGSSIRGLAQYRITHDDHVYRFDLMGYPA